MTTRRSFLAGTIGVGAGVLSPASSRGAAIDEDFAVLLSDIHLCGAADTPKLRDRLFTRDAFDRRIAEILALRPRPRRVIHFGDLSLENGAVADYALAKEKIAFLENAGISFIHVMGNHDRRGKFASVFPEVGKDSPVPGRYVSVVPFKSFDLVLLDSLTAQENETRDKDPGGLDAAEQAWLAKALPVWPRPVIVGAHHPATELTVNGAPLPELLVASPMVVGWINGHEHLWKKSVLYTWGRREDTIRALGLPSAGFFLDIGFVELRVGAHEAVATLRQSDYHFFGPGAPDERKPEIWRTIVADNQGEHCTFPLTRTIRPWRMG